MKTGVIILAAGGSSRMGTPKQLLQYRGQSLIRRAAETALDSIYDRVVVVIGNKAEQIKAEIDDLSVSVIENRAWRDGMSTSIRVGMVELAKDDPDAVVLMLCDQPFLTAEILNDLVFTHIKSTEPIVASTYDGIQGVPAFFTREFFDELRSLTADEGARRVILKHQQSVATVAFPEGAIDVDTPHEYEQIRKSSIA
jgi:molybdenum cofactor cytidylyltransferase